jgi:hypothetical protein
VDFTFSCKCGTAIVGPLDKMPDELKEITSTTEPADAAA